MKLKHESYYTTGLAKVQNTGPNCTTEIKTFREAEESQKTIQYRNGRSRGAKGLRRYSKCRSSSKGIGLNGARGALLPYSGASLRGNGSESRRKISSTSIRLRSSRALNSSSYKLSPYVMSSLLQGGVTLLATTFAAANPAANASAVAGSTKLPA